MEGEDPNDDGEIVEIAKYSNGYAITGFVYHREAHPPYDDEDIKEGYTYALDMEGNEMEVEELA